MIQLLIHSLISFCDITALATLTGTALIMLYMNTAAKNMPLSPGLPGRLNRLMLVCLGALTATTLYGLVQRSIEMSGLGVTAIFPVLPVTILKTHFGSMWLVRLAGLSAAWLFWNRGRKKNLSLGFSMLLFFSGAVIAFSRSASGHPADFGDLSPQQLADWLHLLSVSSWAGTLLAIAWLFPPLAAASGGEEEPFIAGMATRLYLLFGPLLTVLVLSGLYNAWFAAGSLAVLFTTSYGRLLSVKLFLFLLLLCRYVALPQPGKETGRFAATFLNRTRLDAVAVLGILLSVALLIHIIPARHQAHLEHVKQLAEHKKEAASAPEPIVTLETPPSGLPAGNPVTMKVSIRTPLGEPFNKLVISHERILHAIIISKDLEVFAHIHPEDLGPVTGEMRQAATFPIRYTFPRVGEYLIGFDFAADDESYSRTLPVRVAAAPGMGELKTDFSTKKNFGDYQVSLSSSPERIQSGSEATLKYIIKKNGKDVSTLEPYLGASMHLAIVPVDLKTFMHAHGVTKGETHTDHLHAAPPPSRFGPQIETEVIFPLRGIYKVFSQVKHEGKVLLFDFMLDVQ